MLRLSRIATPPYSFISEGTGASPLAITVQSDGGGGTITSDVLSAYLIATGQLYYDVEVSFTDEEAGANWEMSEDGLVWVESITLPSIDAALVDVALPLYFRAIINNDGSLILTRKIACKINLSGLGRFS